MTTKPQRTQDWTRAMTTHDLERMFTHCTDPQTAREITAELERRDDLAADVTDAEIDAALEALADGAP